jgi:hypothetical protein
VSGRRYEDTGSCFYLCGAGGSPGIAHPPSLVDISLTDTGKVQVMVTHAVGNPKNTTSIE